MTEVPGATILGFKLFVSGDAEVARAVGDAVKAGHERAAGNSLECVRVEIAKLELKPGDVLVLHHPGRLRESHVAYLREQMTKIYLDCKAIVLEEGMSLAVLTRDQLKERMGE